MEQPVALITGAGRGIGRATAEELSRRNYRLALLARNGDELHATQKLCGRGLVLSNDVQDPQAIDHAISEISKEFGRLDAVVHCAGLAPVRNIADTTLAEWQDVINTNLSAAFYLCKSAWPIFTRQRSGVIVNVSSAAARDPFPGFAAYGAAKAGLNLFGLAAAREGQTIGVRVHTVAPAAVETAMFRNILTAEQYPTEKTLSPQDVARVIAQCVVGDLKYSSGEVIYLQKEL